MGLFHSFNINASGMTAQRLRMDVISQNVANVNTTRTADGTPYRRKVVTFQERQISPFERAFRDAREARSTREAWGPREDAWGAREAWRMRDSFPGNGVRVTSITQDPSDFVMRYDPSHPDANADGYVAYPNVNIVTEMTNMISASRSYEANATAFEASKAMAIKGLEIGNV